VQGHPTEGLREPNFGCKGLKFSVLVYIFKVLFPKVWRGTAEAVTEVKVGILNNIYKWVVKEDLNER